MRVDEKKWKGKRIRRGKERGEEEKEGMYYGNGTERKRFGKRKEKKGGRKRCRSGN